MSQESVASIEGRIRSAVSARPVHEYAIPESIRNESSVDLPAKVGLRVLKAGEELIAGKIGRLDYMKAQYESVKMSITTFDGKPVTDQDGAITKFWESCPPKLRSLFLQAYNRISSPTEEESSDFFESENVLIG